MRRLSPAEAVQTFAEDNLGYDATEAVEEARRAVGHDLSTASLACPFGVDIHRAIGRIADGDFDGALATFLDAHPWPGIMGRHCQRMCERAQVVSDDVEPIWISALERAAADIGRHDPIRFHGGSSTGRRVAVVGAGSAGAAVSYSLRRHGHEVAVYEQLSVAGGMMFAGYPAFRLPVAVVEREIDFESWGCETNFDVRIDAALVDQLRGEYDAVVLATGKFASVRMEVPGEDLDGVHDALGFLTSVKLGVAPTIGPRVAVVGGGFTAQDVARTCVRLGARTRIYYRRSRTQLPNAALAEAHIARQAYEGAPYEFELAPVRIAGEAGRVAGIELARTAPLDVGPDGRPGFDLVPGSETLVPCETVIAAVGETVDTSWLPGAIDVRDGQIVVDALSMTTIPGVFAVGETSGSIGTVMAHAAGFSAGDAVDRYVRSLQSA